MSLCQLKKKNRCIIQKLPAVRMLKALGLQEGMCISVICNQPWGGPVVIEAGTRSIALDKTLAKQIVVKEV